MCTGLGYHSNEFYFGRNLDLDYDFGQRVVITPRNYEIVYKHLPAQKNHYAMVGMAAVIDDYPLYAEAVNEKGLGMAGLNFAGFAHYNNEIKEDCYNLTAYEIITWVLAGFDNLADAVQALAKLNMVDTAFKTGIEPAPLHWLLADERETAVLEVTEAGVKIFDNPVGVLTNAPTFDYHLMSLNRYMALSREQSRNNFAADLDLKPLGVGYGAIGLPGDYSPNSRFIKAAFLNGNSVAGTAESENVAHFFHILDAVAMPKGAVVSGDGKSLEYTRYSSCCNTKNGHYYYKVYDSVKVHMIDLFAEDIDGKILIDKGYN